MTTPAPGFIDLTAILKLDTERVVVSVRASEVHVIRDHRVIGSWVSVGTRELHVAETPDEVHEILRREWFAAHHDVAVVPSTHVHDENCGMGS